MLLSVRASPILHGARRGHGALGVMSKAKRSGQLAPSFDLLYLRLCTQKEDMCPLPFTKTPPVLHQHKKKSATTPIGCNGGGWQRGRQNKTDGLDQKSLCSPLPDYDLLGLFLHDQSEDLGTLDPAGLACALHSTGNVYRIA